MVSSFQATNGALANNSDFPSLGEAAKQPAPSKKAAKSKGKKMSLTDFIAQPGAAAGFQDKSLQDKAILMSLPTAPRGLRDGEDPRAGPGMGGGFRDYGGRDGGKFVSAKCCNEEVPWPGVIGDAPPFAGFRGERGERGDRPPRAEMEPSRADAVDDWGTTRKFVPGGGDGGSRGFGGGFGDRDRAPREPREFKPSAADEVDDWGAQRKFEPSAGARGFGDDRRGGFGDRERRFDGPPPPSKADMEDSWGRGREFKPTADAPSRPSRGFSGDNASAADKEERWGRRAPEPSTSAAESSAPSERPRLKLAPRSVPADGAGAGSSDAAGAGSKSNPFGAARPREEVLKEKGVDPVKEALKLEHGEVIRWAVGL